MTARSLTTHYADARASKRAACGVRLDKGLKTAVFGDLKLWSNLYGRRCARCVACVGKALIRFT